MARREFLGSVVETTTTGSLTSTDTSISLTDGSTFPAGSTSPFTIVIDRGTASEEKILITSRSSNTLTVSQRGYDGTTATTHSSGANVDHVLDATSVQDMNTSINDVTDVITADTANNRVGIGTTSPAEELHILKDQDGDLTQVLIENTDQRVRIGSYYEAGVTQYGKIQSEQDAGGDIALALNPEGGNVGIGTTSPSAELDVVGNIESTTVRITSTTDTTSSSTDHGLAIGGTHQVRIDDHSVMGWSTGTVAPLYLQKYGSQLRIGETTDADVYLNGFLQGHWTSYTPTLYTGNYSGSPTHTLGSNGAITARYCVWGNVVFVQMDVSYGDFTAGNSTLQPRYSVPSGLRVVPTRGVGNGQGDFMGVGNMSGYMTHDYIGAMMAFNDGQHSSNGFFQFTQADSSSAGGNYNAYDAMYSGATYTNDDSVGAYGRIVMSGWYRTDAL